MKLRNKKTGEIFCWDEKYMPFGFGLPHPTSLAELNEEWEDYEEPKKPHYYVEPRGQVIELVFGDDVDELKEELCEIGNYFETKEEAEKAVEKLKAWKRLKDKGFRFEWYQFHDILSGVLNIKAEFENSSDTQIVKDLDLLFGGEE